MKARESQKDKATATVEFAPWRRSKIFRSPKGREWIEIENDDRMICEISNEYLAMAHLEKEDEDIADLMITAVNERDQLLAEVARLREALHQISEAEHVMSPCATRFARNDDDDEPFECDCPVSIARAALSSGKEENDHRR
jgi:hypothetical protein